jgi:hypothetical protein
MNSISPILHRRTARRGQASAKSEPAVSFLAGLAAQVGGQWVGDQQDQRVSKDLHQEGAITGTARANILAPASI